VTRTTKVHLGIFTKPSAVRLVAACGQSFRNEVAGTSDPVLRRQRHLVTCEHCRAWSDAERGHPWLVFYGTQFALVWARTKR
jgi:hypothetical protein